MLDRDELVTDLKAAVQLGAAEALDLALDALGEWGNFVSNARLSEEDVLKLLVPLGEVLAEPSVPYPYLQMLATHRLVGARALAAVAWGVRYLRAQPVDRQMLAQLGADRRAEVRVALRAVLRRHGKANPQRLAALLETWLNCHTSPRLQILAVESLSALPPDMGLRLAVRCRDVEHEKVQAALGKTLRKFAAAREGKAVLTLLEAWAQTDPLPSKVITTALRGGWAMKTDRQRALAILDLLEQHGGSSRALRRARQGLERRV